MRSKRKRILKEGPTNTLLGNLFEEEERDKVNIYAIEAVEAKAEVATKEMQEARLFSTFRSDKHRWDGY
ncbi:unnamed protein product [Calypogeia fissa]